MPMMALPTYPYISANRGLYRVIRRSRVKTIPTEAFSMIASISRRVLRNVRPGRASPAFPMTSSADFFRRRSAIVAGERMVGGVVLSKRPASRPITQRRPSAGEPARAAPRAESCRCPLDHNLAEHLALHEILKRRQGFLESEDAIDHGTQPRGGDRAIHGLEARPAAHEDPANGRQARCPRPARDLDGDLVGAPRDKQHDLPVQRRGPHRLFDRLG